MLRLGLAMYLEKAPQKIALATNRHGKPCVAECSALHFNVSHSGGLGAIAFTTEGEVGIDVEAIRCDVGALEIASAHFTRNEAAMVAAAATAQEQASAFLRLWTRKEAVLKAAGCGLLGGLEGVDVSHEPLDQVKLCGATGDGTESYWRIQIWKRSTASPERLQRQREIGRSINIRLAAKWPLEGMPGCCELSAGPG